MAEFVAKLNNEEKERVFLKKLSWRFMSINSKNLLLDRSLETFNNKKNIYAVVNITPVIPNIPKIASIISLILYFIIYFIFSKNWVVFLYGFLILGSMAFFWTKYFYYFMLRRSSKKNGIKKIELM